MLELLELTQLQNKTDARVNAQGKEMSEAASCGVGADNDTTQWLLINC